MACNFWDEMGLLYSSDELSEQEKQTFIAHLQQCPECSHELDLYKREKEAFFINDILGETPSPACDAEILRVCSDGRKKVFGLNMLTLFIRKSVVSAALLVFGFITVSSVIVLMDNRSQKDATTVTTRSEDDLKMVSGNTETFSSEQDVADTAEVDSSQKSKLNYAKTRGNLNTNGVVPVDLLNK